MARGASEDGVDDFRDVKEGGMDKYVYCGSGTWEKEMDAEEKGKVSEGAAIGLCPYCTEKIFDRSFKEHFDKCVEHKKWMWGETYKGDREI
jgi:hypothetical protein